MNQQKKQTYLFWAAAYNLKTTEFSESSQGIRFLREKENNKCNDIRTPVKAGMRMLLYARHGHVLTGVSPERALMAGSA